jgi:hypothetical protein
MGDGIMNNEFVEPPPAELTRRPAPPRKIGRAALSKKSVLIIGDDNDYKFYDDQSVPTFTSAFKNMGYKVRIEKSDETIYLTWDGYDIVVWSCGDDYTPINDPKSRRMLIDYVTRGGRLLLESGNIAAFNKEFGGETILNRDFSKKVLHATTDWVYHDVGNLKLKTMHPIATTPNILPDIIDFIPTEPGDDSGDANAVRILPDATGIYGWSHVAYNGNLVKESIASISFGLIAYDENLIDNITRRPSIKGSRIIYYAFDIDNIVDTDIQQKLIQNSENWLLA